MSIEVLPKLHKESPALGCQHGLMDIDMVDATGGQISG